MWGYLTPGIYSLNLDTGAATLLNELTGDNAVFFPYSLAIAPAVTAVPEPGVTAWLMGLITLPLFRSGRRALRPLRKGR